MNIIQCEYTPSSIHPEPTKTTTKTTTKPTTKTSVYASFKKNKRIETSSLYTNHYRYMGKLLDYEEFKSHQAVMLKYNQSCKQHTAAESTLLLHTATWVTYHDYKYKIGEASKYVSVVDVSGASVAQINVVEEPFVLLDCSTNPNDAIPDHEKVD